MMNLRELVKEWNSKDLSEEDILRYEYDQYLSEFEGLIRHRVNKPKKTRNENQDPEFQ